MQDHLRILAMDASDRASASPDDVKYLLYPDLEELKACLEEDNDDCHWSQSSMSYSADAKCDSLGQDDAEESALGRYYLRHRPPVGHARRNQDVGARTPGADPRIRSTERQPAKEPAAHLESTAPSHHTPPRMRAQRAGMPSRKSGSEEDEPSWREGLHEQPLTDEDTVAPAPMEDTFRRRVSSLGRRPLREDTRRPRAPFSQGQWTASRRRKRPDSPARQPREERVPRPKSARPGRRTPEWVREAGSEEDTSPRRRPDHSGQGAPARRQSTPPQDGSGWLTWADALSRKAAALCSQPAWPPSRRAVAVLLLLSVLLAVWWGWPAVPQTPPPPPPRVHVDGAPALHASVHRWVEQMSALAAQFPHQRRSLWMRLRATVNRMLVKGQQPAVVLVLAGEGQRADARCLLRAVAAAVLNATGTPWRRPLLLDAAALAPLDEAEAKGRLGARLDDIRADTGGVETVLLEDVQLLQPRTAMLLHGFCDNDNAPRKTAVFLLSLVTDEPPPASDAHLRDAVERRLWSAWGGVLSEEIFDALLTRIAGNLVAVAGEGDQLSCRRT